jgi:hypothetical protein
MLTRRGLLGSLAAIAGGIILDRAIPFGRVYSFPREIKCMNVFNGCPGLGFDDAVSNHWDPSGARFMRLSDPINSRRVAFHGDGVPTIPGPNGEPLMWHQGEYIPAVYSRFMESGKTYAMNLSDCYVMRPPSFTPMDIVWPKEKLLQEDVSFNIISAAM